MNNNNNNNNNTGKQYDYYASIVMLIIMSIEFILSIVFLGVMAEVKNSLKMKDLNYQYDGICLTFSFSFISFFVFVLYFIIDHNCKAADFGDPFEKLFKGLNHFISLITFIICQLLYFVDCCIIPVYLQGLKMYEDIGDKIIKNAIKKYTALVVVGYIFLGIIIFLDFIVLNLFRKMCCGMKEICDKTEECGIVFVKRFADFISCSCCKEEESESRARKEINDLNGEIKHLFAKYTNLSLQIENNDNQTTH